MANGLIWFGTLLTIAAIALGVYEVAMIALGMTALVAIVEDIAKGDTK